MTTLEKVYGNLKVISPVGPGRFYCQCQCKDKKTLIADGEELKSGKKQDCGCGAAKADPQSMKPCS